MIKNILILFLFIIPFFRSALLGQDCGGLSITNEIFSASKDLSETVSRKTGRSVTIADWRQLESMNNIDEWISCMNLKQDQTFMINFNGQLSIGGKYFYYVHYSPRGKPYSSFAVHSQINNKLFLGAWYGLKMSVLINAEKQKAIPVKFRLTRNQYSERDDIISKLQEEFGKKAQLADWEQIITEVGRDTKGFCEEIGLQNKAAAMVKLKGNRFWGKSSRQYFITRFDNGPDAGYLVHEKKGVLYLGSWYNIKMPCIVKTADDYGDNQQGTILQHNISGKYSNDRAYIYIKSKNEGLFAISDLFSDELKLHNSASAELNDFYVEFENAEGKNYISLKFGEEPNGDHYLTFQFDVSDIASLMVREDAKMPATVNNWYYSNKWQNPCSGFRFRPILTDYYDMNRDKNDDYIFWNVGCPETRGRGEVQVFDGRTGEIVFNWFGYEITGAYQRDTFFNLYNSKKKK